MSAIASAVRRHPTVTALLVAVVVVGVAVGLFLFQPWKLWVDETVDEPLPGAPAVENRAEGNGSEGDKVGQGDGQPQAAPSFMTLARGRFRSLAHAGEGTALVLERDDGARFLRFESFEVENGPDLKVYLSAAPADSEDDDAFNTDFVSLGALKGNIGNQNYVIPEGVDLSRYQSAVIWCRRFGVGFAVAPLNA